MRATLIINVIIIIVTVIIIFNGKRKIRWVFQLRMIKKKKKTDEFLTDWLIYHYFGATRRKMVHIVERWWHFSTSWPGPWSVIRATWQLVTWIYSAHLNQHFLVGRIVCRITLKMCQIVLNCCVLGHLLVPVLITKGREGLNLHNYWSC